MRVSHIKQLSLLFNIKEPNLRWRHALMYSVTPPSQVHPKHLRKHRCQHLYIDDYLVFGNLALNLHNNTNLHIEVNKEKLKRKTQKKHIHD